MLHPNDFRVNQAWIAFKLNDLPLVLQSGDKVGVIALMDAASCFILSSELVSMQSLELSSDEALRLLTHAQSHKQHLPEMLYLAGGLPGGALGAEAASLGIDVLHASANDLSLFIEEAQEGFKQHFGSGSPF